MGLFLKLRLSRSHYFCVTSISLRRCGYIRTRLVHFNHAVLTRSQYSFSLLNNSSHFYAATITGLVCFTLIVPGSLVSELSHVDATTTTGPVLCASVDPDFLLENRLFLTLRVRSTSLVFCSISMIVLFSTCTLRVHRWTKI